MTNSQGETVPETPQELLERQSSPRAAAVIAFARGSQIDLRDSLLIVDQLLLDLDQSFQWYLQQGLESGQEAPERLLGWMQWSTGLSGLRCGLAPMLHGFVPRDS